MGKILMKSLKDARELIADIEQKPQPQQELAGIWSALSLNERNIFLTAVEERKTIKTLTTRWTPKLNTYIQNTTEAFFAVRILGYGAREVNIKRASELYKYLIWFASFHSLHEVYYKVLESAPEKITNGKYSKIYLPLYAEFLAAEKKPERIKDYISGQLSFFPEVISTIVLDYANITPFTVHGQETGQVPSLK